MNIGLSNEEREAVGMDLGIDNVIFGGTRRAKRAKNAEIWGLSAQ